MTCAIVLAAGESRRMGTQKLLLPFAGSTVVARVVDAFLGAAIGRVIVVVRSGDVRLRSALAGRTVDLVENPDSTGDMLSSLRCGLRVLPERVRTILVSPGDQPSIEPGLIGQLLAAYRASGRDIMVPVHAGRRGHPLVFAGHYRNELLTAHDGVGLRGLLRAHATEVGTWETDRAAVLEDLDTPAAFLRAQRRSQVRGASGPGSPVDL